MCRSGAGRKIWSPDSRAVSVGGVVPTQVLVPSDFLTQWRNPETGTIGRTARGMVA